MITARYSNSEPARLVTIFDLADQIRAEHISYDNDITYEKKLKLFRKEFSKVSKELCCPNPNCQGRVFAWGIEDAMNGIIRQEGEGNRSRRTGFHHNKANKECAYSSAFYHHSNDNPKHRTPNQVAADLVLADQLAKEVQGTLERYVTRKMNNNILADLLGKKEINIQEDEKLRPIYLSLCRNHPELKQHVWFLPYLMAIQVGSFSSSKYNGASVLYRAAGFRPFVYADHKNSMCDMDMPHSIQLVKTQSLLVDDGKNPEILLTCPLTEQTWRKHHEKIMRRKFLELKLASLGLTPPSDPNTPALPAPHYRKSRTQKGSTIPGQQTLKF